MELMDVSGASSSLFRLSCLDPRSSSFPRVNQDHPLLGQQHANCRCDLC
ncbi:hypothetical protein HMPREF1980_00364 [Actinomyces sp. oral taxon 172 str. F0311]|nr:hypothetical protein HMPREF1980_00364 [Actinomyces sp. oral taxon 172 str. F0311]